MYAPTKDQYTEQQCFLEYLRELLQKHEEKNLILAGDFNTYLNCKLDKKGGSIESETKFSKGLKLLCEEYTLIDMWRASNPIERKYTWRDNTRAGVVQARLDYFLISQHLNYLISNCSFKPGYKSDHSLISLSIDLLDTHKRGKSYWKFNNSLLYDKTYVQLIKEELKMLATDNTIKDKSSFWDFVKCKIRSLTISYSVTLAKRKRKQEEILFKKLESMENNLDLNTQEYNIVKREWENIQFLKTEGSILRSKAQWVEHGEKNNKYFLNLEKKNYNVKYIKKLITEKSVIITKPDEILQEEKKFYEDLYTSKIDQCDADASNSFLKPEIIPQINDIDKQICDAPLKLEELMKAVKELKNDKTPGNDGLTSNFYKFFWSDIRLFLFDSFRYSFENDILSNDQRRGILNLIPKANKDLRHLKNWRPVTILNTDYKILTKVLANRLQPLLEKIITSDQVGYIKGRQITENIRIISDIMSYTDLKHISGFIALIDFEKAFDSVEWPFLLKTLKAFNFGNNFLHWIKILYTDIQSCVSNNGYFSEYFQLSRGIRQGCPISAMLFILVAEVMAIHIRNNDKIRGIKEGKSVHKICQLADDTTLFLQDIESLGETILQLKNFQACSGLKINLEKTEVIPIGVSKQKDINLPKSLSSSVINKGPFKTLGIWFSHDCNEMIRLNYQSKINKINSLINIWLCRNLSLKGKIQIIKSLLLPQLNYVLSNIYCPSQILKEIDKILIRFLWNNNPPKVKKSTIIGNYSDGGLKMPDIFTINTTAKVKWIKRLMASSTFAGNWQGLFLYLLNIDKNLLKHKLPSKVKDKGLTPFYKQVLECWGEFHGNEPDTVEEIQ